MLRRLMAAEMTHRRNASSMRRGSTALSEEQRQESGSGDIMGTGDSGENGIVQTGETRSTSSNSR